MPECLFLANFAALEPWRDRLPNLLIGLHADRCYDQAVAPHSPMSEEQLKAFLEKVKSDTELQEKLKAAGSNEAAIEIAKAAGFAITTEDIQLMQSQSREVSDNELEAAAGGNAVCHVADTLCRLSRSVVVTRRFLGTTGCRCLQYQREPVG